MGRNWLHVWVPVENESQRIQGSTFRQNKIFKSFKPFIRRLFLRHSTLRSDRSKIGELLANKSGRLVIKGSGTDWFEVEVINCIDYSPASLIDYMTKRGYDLIEEYVIQHPALMDLSPSGLNSVRIITQMIGTISIFLAAVLGFQ